VLVFEIAHFDYSSKSSIKTTNKHALSELGMTKKRKSDWSALWDIVQQNFSLTRIIECATV
jgi:hypothetical protein